MARPTQDPRILWRDSDGKTHERSGEGRRAFADFRSYADVGGGREALSEPGQAWGTTDPEIARRLFTERLEELQELRRGRVLGQGQRTTTFRALAVDHLKKKREADISEAHRADLKQRLQMAEAFFGARRDPRTIEPKDVRAWADDLAKDGTRKPGTVRHYLNALSGLYGRAQEGLFVPPGYNPVAMMQEKPTGRWKGEAAFLEIAEGALVLEAARVLAASRADDARERAKAAPGIYPIVATFLLTGGRKSEVLGLDVEDVSFDRGVIHFRPNRHRGLKTSTSHRTVPLWPQLRGILQEWMYGGETPRTEGLLFPARQGGMIGDIRKSLDAIAGLCGMEEGDLRTRAFRHTYCSVRLQTVQRIVKPGKDPATDPDAYEYVEVSKFQVQKEMGHGGAQLVDRIYGHGLRSPHRLEAVEYSVERHREELGERLRVLEAVG